VTIAIYGSTERAGDILSLNGIEDTSRIRAGTVIRYYK
jgi:hypothetical protein